MKIAITTPTGHVGSATIQALKGTGAELVLVARHPESLATGPGIRVAQASQDDAAAVTRATEGVDALLWVTPPNPAAEDLRAWQGRCTEAGMAAVRANKIPWVVVLSSVGGHLPSGTGPVTGLYDAEKGLEAVTRNILHLRPTFFMENYLGHLATARDEGRVYMPVRGPSRATCIAAQDIGRYAASRLLDPGDGRQLMGLRGPDETTWEGLAATLGEALHRSVQLIQVTPEQGYAALTGMGIGPSTARAYVELYAASGSGLLAQERGTPETITSTRFADWARARVAGVR